MRWSEAFIPTLRENPKDAEALSHKLMVRSGLIRRLGSGAYSYLPLGFKVLNKIIGIIRDEMDLAGAQECLLPALQPIELWKATGRDKVLGDVLIKFKDRTDKEVALGPTHEEVITSLVSEIKSYKQLPITLYQIQTKFRDEPRPRFGVIRSKEFIMKDAYSFDVDLDGLNKSYQKMFEAYQKIFRRCGLSVLECEASSGAMGGDVSHEFMAASENGEDIVVSCASCGYSANMEAAKCKQSAISAHVGNNRGGSASGGSDQQSAKEEKAFEEVATPGKHTVEQVSRFLKASPKQIIKTLLYEAGPEVIAVLVRGDHEVNEAKLSRIVSSPLLRLASPSVIEKITRAPVGFSGPVGLKGVKLIADPSVMEIHSAVTGANKAEHHLVNVRPGRDFTPSQIVDVRFVTEEDTCVRCAGSLKFVKAIEVGHVFKLGIKYSQALGAIVQDDDGSQVPMIMGCYGIGVNRIAAAVIEQKNDANGIIWPRQISPFEVVISVLEVANKEALEAGKEIAQFLENEGLDVLLDDREQSPGSKLKDADLIGVPLQIVIGKAWQSEKRFEVVERCSKNRHQIERDNLLPTVHKLLDSA